MIKVAAFLVGVLMGATAYGQENVDARRAAMRALIDQEYARDMARPAKRRRIYETRPARRDWPLRYLNVSDKEVLEIKAAALEVVPRSIVNISGVTSGCPCEEGPACNAQVWIEAMGPDKSRGLQLSKIGPNWTIGTIQTWWLELESLQARRASFASNDDYKKAEDGWVDMFPECVVQPTVPGGPPAPRTAPEPQR